MFFRGEAVSNDGVGREGGRAGGQDGDWRPTGSSDQISQKLGGRAEDKELNLAELQNQKDAT